MELKQKIIYGLGGVLILVILLSVFDISLKKPLTGIYQISGKRGEHSVDLETDVPEKSTIENFTAPLNYVMNSGSNQTLEASLSNSYDIQQPKEVSLEIDSTVTYQGTPLPLNTISSEQANVTNGTTVDGTKSTPPSMMMFKYNQCKPECCPGPYSCDRGCICKTGNQTQFISTRGNNNI